MIDLEFAVLIDCPVSNAYAFLTNPMNLTRWQENVKEVRAISPGPVGVGSTFAVISEALGRRIEGRMEVVEMEPDNSFTFQMTAGPMQLRLQAALKTVGTGTRLALHAQGEPAGIFKLAEGALVGQVRSLMEANLARLKAVLEGDQS
jgi:carbon monoxide dehydrogenase subunit G